MPNIGQGTSGPDFDAIKKRKQDSSSKKKQKSEDELTVEEEQDDDSEDEIIAASKKAKAEGKGLNYRNIGIGIGVVLIIVVVFLILGRQSQAKKQQQAEEEAAQLAAQQAAQQQENQSTEDTGDLPSSDVGTVDFTQDTNNKSDSPMTDPNQFTKDIYGLTTRVDYEVADIQSAADFVNYTKHRGTWGGGIELYYLDAEYRGAKYVIQVPFKYYKELPDDGIVPVKMELLRIRNQADASQDSYLTVISYMSLDEETLKNILKSQSR